MNRSILAPSLLALSLSLTGCVTGGNIKGDFQCSAPGGTCAPMSTIDAAAISGIGSFRSIGEPGIEGQSVPRGIAGPVLADGTAPARTSDRVLRVVFPAHIDADGIYREQSAAHAVVENGAWAEALGGKPVNPRGVPALRAAGVVPAAPAAPSALATLDEIVAARAAQSGAQRTQTRRRCRHRDHAHGSWSRTGGIALRCAAFTGRGCFGIDRAARAQSRSPRADRKLRYARRARSPLNGSNAGRRLSPARRAVPPSGQQGGTTSGSTAPSSVLPQRRPMARDLFAGRARPISSPTSNPQPTASASAAPEAAQPDHTADLNKASLARVSQSSAVLGEDACPACCTR